MFELRDLLFPNLKKHFDYSVDMIDKIGYDDAVLICSVQERAYEILTDFLRKNYNNI